MAEDFLTSARTTAVRFARSKRKLWLTYDVQFCKFMLVKKGKVTFVTRTQNGCSTGPISFLWVKLTYFRSQKMFSDVHTIKIEFWGKSWNSSMESGPRRPWARPGREVRAGRGPGPVSAQRGPDSIHEFQLFPQNSILLVWTCENIFCDRK